LKTFETLDISFFKKEFFISKKDFSSNFKNSKSRKGKRLIHPLFLRDFLMSTFKTYSNKYFNNNAGQELFIVLFNFQEYY